MSDLNLTWHEVIGMEFYGLCYLWETLGINIEISVVLITTMFPFLLFFCYCTTEYRTLKFSNKQQVVVRINRIRVNDDKL